MGVRIKFPAGKKPFAPQIAVMSKAISSLSKAENALLESPTGTGKTLALLTASLSWQQHEYATALKKYEAQAASMSVLVGRGVLEPIVDVDKLPALPPMPVKRQIYYMSRTHSQLKQVIQQLRTMHPSLANNVTMSLLGSRDHLCVNEHARNYREEMPSAQSLDDACREMCKKHTCTFGNVHRIEAGAKALESAILDIEDCVAVGKKTGFCPYFATRELAARADIIFCPYNYVLDVNIKKAMGMKLQGTVLVIDEGHNIAEVCREGSTVVFTEKKLQEASEQLKRLQKKGEIYTKLLGLTQGLIHWLQSKVQLLQGMPPPAANCPAGQLPNVLEPIDVMEDFDRELGLTRDTLQVYSDTLNEIVWERNNMDPDMYPEKESKESSEQNMSLSLATILLFASFIGVCQKLLVRKGDAMVGKKEGPDEGLYHNDYKIIIDADDGQSAGGGDFRGGQRGRVATPDPKVTFLCLNAAVGFREATHGVRSVLVTSGTLSPLASFASELGTAFDHNVEAKHVIASRQLFAGAVGSLGNQSLESTFKAQNSTTYQDAVLRTIVEACGTVPNGAGALIFFPSYGLMDKLKRRWTETGELDFLSDGREVFTEPRNSRECEVVLRQYLSALDQASHCGPRAVARGRGGAGAVLFCVCRGKVSEGLDFSDDKARLVILVGIPYPPAFDIVVRLKKEYQDKMFRLAQLAAAGGVIAVESGDKWYESQAWRAVNQAVGRCIRHRHDWGCLLFLDPRFKQPRNKAVLSKWLRDEVRDFDGYQSMHLELKLFMSQLSSDPPGGVAVKMERTGTGLNPSGPGQAVSTCAEPTIKTEPQQPAGPRMWWVPPPKAEPGAASSAAKGDEKEQEVNKKRSRKQR